MSSWHARLGRPRAGFSLVEVLAVLALVGVLAVLSAPALASLSASGKVNQSLAELAGLLAEARQLAVARNTYVWVAFRPTVSAEGDDELAVAVLASKDGTDPNPWSDYGTVPGDGIDLVSRLRVFRQIKLKEAGSFTADDVPALAGAPKANASHSLADQTAVFRIREPGSSGPVPFTRAVQFTPTGAARNLASPIDLVEFNLQAARSAHDQSGQVAVFRISGLTGQTQLYRP